jgi:hypothetical protein
VGTKGLCLAGPPRSGETSRPDSRDPVASGVKCGPHGGKKSKTKSSTGAGEGQRLTTRVYTRGSQRFTRKPSGYLVEPQNQDRRLGGQRRDPAAPRSFDVGGHVAGSQGLHRPSGGRGLWQRRGHAMKRSAT